MYTLIEIFDSKQYENIITPLSLDNLSKIIYIGSQEVMSKAKINDLKEFFYLQEITTPIEFYQIERDNPKSLENLLSTVTKDNENCVFDATGGEDLILTSLGVFAGKNSFPIIRTNTRSGKICEMTSTGCAFSFKEPDISLEALITLEGGRIVSSTNAENLSADDEKVVFDIFSINSINCENFIMFCNNVSEHISDDNKFVYIPDSELIKMKENVKGIINETFKRLISKKLVLQIPCSSGLKYSIESPVAASCMKKAGNTLEYYTALTVKKKLIGAKDIRIGASIEWNGGYSYSDTLNEIDVLAVYDNKPLFISCKNGEVKKEALYELDAVSRALGGSYSKKILVCTRLSKNKTARDHIVKRSRDMKVGIIYNTHKLSQDRFGEFLESRIEWQ